MSNSQFRWGIIGLGSIASQFATGLKASDGAVLAAVGSRTLNKANAFASEFGAERAYGSYAEVAADPNVDAIYVATPHPEHFAGAKLAIEAGKAALLEKPFTLNSKQAIEIVELARSRRVFVMEGMWTRFFPLMKRVRELVAANEIGELRMVKADFGFRAGWDPQSRILNPELGGGALLDVGIYTISLANMLLGAPEKVTGLTHLGETGIDEISAIVASYSGGKLAVLTSAVRLNMPVEVRLLGEAGSIDIDAPFYKPSAMTVKRDEKPDERIELPFTGNGFNYEADEVKRCVQAGEMESPVMPLDETVQMMQTMDELRNLWGFKYPME